MPANRDLYRERPKPKFKEGDLVSLYVSGPGNHTEVLNVYWNGYDYEITIQFPGKKQCKFSEDYLRPLNEEDMAWILAH